MSTMSVTFYGGPFDGLVWQRSAHEQFNEQVAVLMDHAPGSFAIYWRRRVPQGTDHGIEYVYERTLVLDAG
jgi:hypothetical protein